MKSVFLIEFHPTCRVARGSRSGGSFRQEDSAAPGVPQTSWMKDPLMMPSDEVPGPLWPVGVGEAAGASNVLPTVVERGHE